MGDSDIEKRRVEEGVLFSEADASAKIWGTVKARGTNTFSLAPAVSVGVVPVGIEVKCDSDSLYVQDVKVGKNSQSVCVGAFSHRLLDGRKLFRMDEIDPMGWMAISISLYNESDVDLNVDVILSFEAASASSRLFHPYPLHSSSAGVGGLFFDDFPVDGPESFSARTQVGGYLVGMLLHPDFHDSVTDGDIHFRVTAVDFDPHPDQATALLRSRLTGQPFTGRQFPSIVRPGTRRTVTLTTMPDPGLMLFDHPMPIWVSESTTVEIVGKPPRQPKVTDFLLIMDIDRTDKMNGLDAPRFDGNILRRWR